MAHTYADLNTFRLFLTDGGQVGADDATMLAVLEGASRRVDAFCDRSSFDSGFGPRIGTNKYDHDGCDVLTLRDDLLTAGTVAVLSGTGGTSSTLTEDTDFYLRPYANSPYREVVISGLGLSASRGLRVASVYGTWGYQNAYTAIGTSAGTISVSANTGTVPSSVYAGQTLLIDTEHLYVTAVSGGTATFLRGQNGTEAAGHAAGGTVSVFTYPAEVESATLLVAQRRWKGRDAGMTGDYGGGVHIPVVAARDTERSMLNATVGHLRVFGVG